MSRATPRREVSSAEQHPTLSAAPTRMRAPQIKRIISFIPSKDGHGLLLPTAHIGQKAISNARSDLCEEHFPLLRMLIFIRAGYRSGFERSKIEHFRSFISMSILQIRRVRVWRFSIRAWK